MASCPRKRKARKILHGRGLRRTGRGQGEGHSDDRKTAELAMLHGGYSPYADQHTTLEKRGFFGRIGLTFGPALPPFDLLLWCDRERRAGSSPECCCRAPD